MEFIDSLLCLRQLTELQPAATYTQYAAIVNAENCVGKICLSCICQICYGLLQDQCEAERFPLLMLEVGMNLHLAQDCTKRIHPCKHHFVLTPVAVSAALICRLETTTLDKCWSNKCMPVGPNELCC